MSAQNPIIKRNGSSIGSPAAEDDDQFLFENFVESDAFSDAVDFESPRFILLGRTGSGKTAILRKIESSKERVRRIDPQELSLKYISNSDIIQFLASLGVRLGMFYELLWRHVLATELMKSHFKLKDKKSTNNFLSDLKTRISGKRKRALEYLETLGDEFWLDVDSRVTQVTKKFEESVEVEAGIKLELIKAGGKAADKLTTEEKNEYQTRAQKVVDNVKIQELSEVINWLAEEVFTDPKDRWFVVIDDLDAPFAAESTRYELIRALIETAKKFRKISNVRINIGMRTDLLEKTFEVTKDLGFQSEKYEGNINEIRWDDGGLIDVVDRRLDALYKLKYSSKTPLQSDSVFVDKINSKPTINYIVERTLNRPRDVIAFVNECLGQAVGQSKVGAAEVRRAEVEYSAKRFEALEAEWRLSYPLLRQYVLFLKGQPRRFKLADVPLDIFAHVQKAVTDSPEFDKDELASLSFRVGNVGSELSHEFIFELINVLYKVGIISVRPKAAPKAKSAITGRQQLNIGDVDAGTIIYVHPMLWQFLNIKAYVN